MSRFENTPSGSEFGRRRLLALAVGAGAATLTSCSSKGTETGTSETPETPTTPSETPSVEVTPSETQGQTPEVPDVSEMTIALAKEMSTEERMIAREKYEDLPFEKFLELSEEARMSLSVIVYRDFKEAGRLNPGDEHFGYENGELFLVDPFKPTNDPSEIVKQNRLLRQMALTTPERPTPSKNYALQLTSNSYENPTMDIVKLEADLEAAGISNANVARGVHGAFHRKYLFEQQLRELQSDNFTTSYAASFAIHEAYNPEREDEIEHGTYRDIITGEEYPAVLIPVAFPGGEGGQYVYAQIGDYYKLIGNKSGNTVIFV